MPSTRSQPLNPKLLPGAGTSARAAPRPVPTAPEDAAASKDPVERAAAVARAGGFHESSYELRNGLDVNESEWPPDTTIPGALGDR